jgi:hypothetical protein
VCFYLVDWGDPSVCLCVSEDRGRCDTREVERVEEEIQILYGIRAAKVRGEFSQSSSGRNHERDIFSFSPNRTLLFHLPPLHFATI